MASRVPFEFTLMDRRHRPFVEGQRDTLLTFVQFSTAIRCFRIAGILIVSGVLLFWGGKSLIHDYSVRWLRTEGTVTHVAPVQSGSRFNWWYTYTFRPPEGRDDYNGTIVREERGDFELGQKVPVLYVASDPVDSRFADDPLPRGYRDWYFIALSAGLLAFAAYTLRSLSRQYEQLRGLAREGQPVQGTLVSVSPRPDARLDVAIVYRFTVPGTSLPQEVITKVPLTSFAAGGKPLPQPGTPVAVWCADFNRALLL